MFLAHRIWCFDLILNFHAEHFCSKIALIHKLLDTKEGLYFFYFFYCSTPLHCLKHTESALHVHFKQKCTICVIIPHLPSHLFPKYRPLGCLLLDPASAHVHGTK